MRRYTFYGFYNYDESLFKDYSKSGREIICVPFLDKTTYLRYGIQKTFKYLLKLNVVPSELGFDILTFATLVYLADTRVSRDIDSQDSWTREFSLVVPVSNPDVWIPTKDHFEKMLRFLTGDIWDINYCSRNFNVNEITPKVKIISLYDYDTVSLFSGGMDSLIFAINSLEEKKTPLFISHAGDGYTKNYQKEIINTLSNNYADISFSQLNLWMSFNKHIVSQSCKENTTRSRSFLYISLALFALSGLPKVDILDVPENGLIAINVPLDDLRVGSHSTRTTHPYYFKLWNEILGIVNLGKSIRNPYWNKTKGEMARDCLNKELLLDLLPISMSCSAPTKYRYRGSTHMHCGHCVPCIIRRAAINFAFGQENDKTQYYIEDLDILKQLHNTETGAQLRSFEVAIQKLTKKPSISEFLIHKSGPLDHEPEYLHELCDVYTRGLFEVASLLNLNKKD